MISRRGVKFLRPASPAANCGRRPSGKDYRPGVCRLNSKAARGRVEPAANRVSFLDAATGKANLGDIEHPTTVDAFGIFRQRAVCWSYRRNDRIVRCGDVATGGRITKLIGHRGQSWVRLLFFDGRTQARHRQLRQSIRVWNVSEYVKSGLPRSRRAGREGKALPHLDERQYRSTPVSFAPCGQGHPVNAMGEPSTVAIAKLHLPIRSHRAGKRKDRRSGRAIRTVDSSRAPRLRPRLPCLPKPPPWKKSTPDLRCLLGNHRIVAFHVRFKGEFRMLRLRNRYPAFAVGTTLKPLAVRATSSKSACDRLLHRDA
jgi:hypothetical protein